MDSIFQVISNSRANFPEYERKIFFFTIFAVLKEFYANIVWGMKE